MVEAPRVFTRAVGILQQLLAAAEAAAAAAAGSGSDAAAKEKAALAEIIEELKEKVHNVAHLNNAISL